MSKKQEKNSWEKIVKEEGIRIKHLRANGRLEGTIVYKEEGDTISFGSSFPSSKDQPNVERGRQVAYGRYKKRLRDRARAVRITSTGFCFPLYADKYNRETFKRIFKDYYGPTYKS